MVEIPQHELNNLASMEGYEQMLEVDRLCKVYQTDENTSGEQRRQSGEGGDTKMDNKTEA